MEHIYHQQIMTTRRSDFDGSPDVVLTLHFGEVGFFPALVRRPRKVGAVPVTKTNKIVDEPRPNEEDEAPPNTIEVAPAALRSSMLSRGNDARVNRRRVVAGRCDRVR